MSPALDLGHLNDLNDDVVIEVDVEEALKSSILVVQNAAPVPPSWSFLNGLLNHVVQRRRGPKIALFCRTEGCCTKIWRRISPGFHWYHQK